MSETDKMTEFNPMKISAALSLVFADVYGANISQHRKRIQGSVGKIEEHLGELYGEAESDIWLAENVERAIAEELRTNYPPAIYESYRRTTSKPPSEHSPNRRAERDPVWAISGPAGDHGGVGRGIKKSEWFSLLEIISKRSPRPIGAAALKAIGTNLDKRKTMGAEKWGAFWFDEMLANMKNSPSLFYMLGVIATLNERSLLCGANWTTSVKSGLASAYFSYASKDTDMMAAKWKAHVSHQTDIGNMRAEFIREFDIEKLSQVICLDADYDIDITGLRSLDQMGALWPIANNVSDIHGHNTAEGAVEPPQWAFMRLAMECALTEPHRTQKAIEFYKALSKREIVFTDALHYACGQMRDFREATAIFVEDRFEDIMEAIKDSAVHTKWSGGVSTNWGKIRGKGSAIAGKRVSKGVLSFWEAIDSILISQGRLPDDKPVTASIPLWHIDVLDLCTREFTNIQPVIEIPDLFFERLKKDEHWTMINPVGDAEMATWDVEAYCQIETQQGAAKTHLSKTVKAATVWNRLLKLWRTSKTPPSIVFRDSIEAYTESTEHAFMSSGTDGAGVIPVYYKKVGNNEPQKRWRASPWIGCAVNAFSVIDGKGGLNARKLRKRIRTVLLMADNLMQRNPANKQSGNVCVGAVGYYEALDIATSHANLDDNTLTEWVSRFSEGWSVVMKQENVLLGRKRGVSSIWKKEPSRHLPGAHFGDQIAKRREGQKPPSVLASRPWRTNKVPGDGKGRFFVTSVFAPYQNHANIAGVTPGGIGTLATEARYAGISNKKAGCDVLPTQFSMYNIYKHRLQNKPDVIMDGGKIDASLFPAITQKMTSYDRENIESRIIHAGILRENLDQGVSITISHPGSVPDLSDIIKRAWWAGVTAVLFAAPDS